MPKLLLIDDDHSLLELLSGYLSDAGYEICAAANGDEGLRTFFSARPDLVILDVSMPERDGWQTLQRMRELATTPVIMLTARNEQENVLRGFSLGADDYMTKPFSFAELAARVQAVLNRAQTGPAQNETKSNLLRRRDLMVDLTTKQVWRGHTLIRLTPTEFKLLVTLMQHAGEVMLPQQLVREVWGEQYLAEVGYVRRYIWHLRRKIETDPDQPTYILNEHGFGYCFVAE